MPIELLYTTKELIKLRKSILFKAIISKEDLKTLNEIQLYFNKK
tara:strand:+ start:19726 stop:19857 length:132 start_codon:yes stop_codon:yes gene_type:complete